MKEAQPQVLSEAQLSSISSAIEGTMAKIRPDIGEIVTNHGKEGAHPLGVALALASAAATVIGSMASATGMPKQAMDAVIESMFSEARTIGADTFNALNNIKNSGLSPERTAEIIQENLQRRAAERDAANDAA